MKSSPEADCRGGVEHSAYHFASMPRHCHLGEARYTTVGYGDGGFDVKCGRQAGEARATNDSDFRWRRVVLFQGGEDEGCRLAVGDVSGM